MTKIGVIKINNVFCTQYLDLIYVLGTILGRWSYNLQKTAILIVF